MPPSVPVSFWRHLVCALVAAFFAVASAHAADTPDNNKEGAEKPAPASTAIPLAELSVQADAATVNLRAIAAGTAAVDRFSVIEKDLPALTREIDARARENARIVTMRPSLDLLRTVERSWESVQKTFEAWSAEITERLAALDRHLERVAELETAWKETLTLARKEQAPSELVARAESVVASIGQTRTAVEQQRAQALRLQSRVAAQEFRVSEALEAIARARDVVLVRLLDRDSPPLWDSAALSVAGERIAADSQDTREAQRTTLQSYVARNGERVLLHLALFAILCALLYWARRRLVAWVESDPSLAHAASVVAYPIASALVLSLMASRFFYPEAPRMLWAIVGGAVLIPTVLVLRRIARPYLLPLLYAVVVFYFVDQIRFVLAAVALLPRALFVAEMIGGMAVLIWFLRTTRQPRDAPKPERRSRLLRFGVQIACGFFLVTALANVAGYVALANVLGNAALRSMYFGLILYMVVEIVDALIEMALRVRPLTLFGMVRRHRELLRRRVRALINAAAVVLWSLFVLDRLAIRSRVIDGVGDFLTAELNVGAISISLSDVLAFVLAVWAAFLVSRFVRFVLDEEIYPHAKLKRGLPYAISRTVHYAILVAGFFIAMGVVGVDMTKFTILAGAFTVGVGFGLQNIFNNFVSGLILLFERPVQVGDVIQMDDAAGVVERIGIRASIVRTSSGSEVIVPNGKLISDRLINWTFSDRQRGFEVPLSVVLGSDPAKVIEVLERAAKTHPKVLEKPDPEALLVRIGPDWMGFELRAATHEVEDWMKVRSEVAVTLIQALVAEKIALR